MVFACIDSWIALDQAQHWLDLQVGPLALLVR